MYIYSHTNVKYAHIVATWYVTQLFYLCVHMHMCVYTAHIPSMHLLNVANTHTQ